MTALDSRSGFIIRARAPRAIAAVLLLLAAGAIVGIVLSARSDRLRVADLRAGAARAATVLRRNLVETDTESGTLGYAKPETVYDRLSGTVTWLPRVGQAIGRGGTLFELDGKPVILLYGSTPAYRGLDSSDGSGPDIRQLNANLLALGYSSYGVLLDDAWQTATTIAVEALQKSLGEKQTGKLTLGRVVFLPGKQLVDALESTIGQPTSLDAGAAILQTSSTRLTVTVDLPASLQSEAVAGARVSVEMPNGWSVRGTIAAVSPVAASASGNGSIGSSGEAGDGSSGGQGSLATVPVTIMLDRRVKSAGLDQASVSVNFAQAEAKHVLSVPVTALIAISGGSYAVQQAAAPHKLLPVRAGLFAAGYVQISGPGIHPGLRVTDSQG